MTFFNIYSQNICHILDKNFFMAQHYSNTLYSEKDWLIFSKKLKKLKYAFNNIVKSRVKKNEVDGNYFLCDPQNLIVEFFFGFPKLKFLGNKGFWAKGREHSTVLLRKNPKINQRGKN